MACSLRANEIYVAPTGDDANEGSISSPYKTISKAIEAAQPGTSIFLREGTYTPTPDQIMLSNAANAYDCVYALEKNGTADRPILLSGYPGEKVTIDLSQVKTPNRIMGFYLVGDHWHLRDFDIVGIQVTQTGHTQSINVGLFGGSNCIVERVNMHDGMGIGVYATHGRNNLILNCDAYNNYDPVSENGYGGNCDGFGFHLNKESYTGNVVRGCRTWRNSDDGYDLINNKAPVTIENCWAWENGFDANRVSRGDGTGFKSGGYGMKANPKVPSTVPRNVVRGCLSWSNKQNGFYANHHLGGLDFSGNTSYANRLNYNMVNRKSAAEAVDVKGYGHRLSENLSFRPAAGNGDCANYDPDKCTLTNNTYPGNVSLTDADFESLDASQLLLPRKADGSLPDITFLRLKPDSKAYSARIGYQFFNQTASKQKD